MMVLLQRRPAADWEIICGNCSAAVSAVTSPKTGRAISKQSAHGLERALNSLGDQIQFEKKIYNRSLGGGRDIFLLRMKCKTAKVAVFGKIPRSLLIAEGTGTERGFAHLPVKTGNAFEGGKGSAGWFVFLRDEPAKMFCAFQEGNKENVRIYSNIIV